MKFPNGLIPGIYFLIGKSGKKQNKQKQTNKQRNEASGVSTV